MRDKIIAALRQAGHGLTLNELGAALTQYGYNSKHDYINLLSLLQMMHDDKLVILHRSSSAADRGSIQLVCLRPEDHK